MEESKVERREKREERREKRNPSLLSSLFSSGGAGNRTLVRISFRDRIYVRRLRFSLGVGPARSRPSRR